MNCKNFLFIYQWELLFLLKVLFGGVGTISTTERRDSRLAVSLSILTRSLNPERTADDGT
jgi:hypothetical protein